MSTESVMGSICERCEECDVCEGRLTSCTEGRNSVKRSRGPSMSPRQELE